MKDDKAAQPSEGPSGAGIQVNSAIVLAGGLGTRLQGVLHDLPKAMAPIQGRPFLEYQMDYWIGQGIRHFILSIGYRREVLMKHFGDQYRGARIEYSIEETPLGTGGGLLLAAKKIDKRAPFLLLNGDTFFEVKLQDLIKFHLARQSDWTFSLFSTSEKKRYLGMEVDAGGRVLSLHSDSVKLEQFANGGVYLVNLGILSVSDWKSGDKLSLENDILPALLAKGVRFFGKVCNGRFIDIGLPDDYFRASGILSA